MSPTNAHSTRTASGFTLVELIVATSISALVFAGILGAFLFLGRNLTRLAYSQQLEENSRRAFYLFSQDISASRQVTQADATTLILKKPIVNDPTQTEDVEYDYSGGKLTRTYNGTASVLLSHLDSFDFHYYDRAGADATLSIKAVDFTFVSSLGNSASGTRTSYSGISPRGILRNTQTNTLLPE